MADPVREQYRSQNERRRSQSGGRPEGVEAPAPSTRRPCLLEPRASAGVEPVRKLRGSLPQRPAERPGGLNLPRELGLRGDARLEGGPFHLGKPPIEVVLQRGFASLVAQRGPPSHCLRSCRARARRDRTVPTGTAVIVAISS